MHGFQIHGFPVAYGVIALACGAGLWHKKWLHRTAMGLFAAAAAFFVIGVVPLQDALAKVTSTGAGLVGLVIVFILAGLGFAVEIRSKRKDARHLAHVCAGVTAVTLVMIIANGARLLREAARSPREAGTALSQSVHSISSGHAARAVNSHQSLVDLAAAAAVIAFLVFAARRHERGGSKKRPASPDSGPRQITSGGSGPRAIPSGKGH